MIITLEDIAKKVKEKTNIDVQSTSSRKRNVVDAKRLYGHLSKEYSNQTYSAIGRFIKMDHATIMHYCSTSVSLIEVDKKYRDLFENCASDFEDDETLMRNKRSYHIEQARKFHTRIINLTKKDINLFVLNN